MTTGQLDQSVLYYNDSGGAILTGTKHFFYEAGTTVRKTVYAEKDLINPLPQPVVSDAGGILPPVWLDVGEYRWIGTDNLGNVLFDRDNVNFIETDINTESPFIFKTEADMIAGMLANGDMVSLEPDNTAYTQGKATQTDGLGEEHLILASDSGGDILLNNGRYAHIQTNYVKPQAVEDLRNDSFVFSAVLRSPYTSLSEIKLSTEGVGFLAAFDPPVVSYQLKLNTNVNIVGQSMQKVSGGVIVNDAYPYPSELNYGLGTTKVFTSRDITGAQADAEYLFQMWYKH